VAEVSFETRLDGVGQSLAAARGPARRAAASGALADVDDTDNRRLSATWPCAQPSVVLNWTLLERRPRPANRPIAVAVRPAPRRGPSPLTAAIQRAFRPRRSLGGWLANVGRALQRAAEGLLAAVLNIR
jgi:hypothetical protein